MLVDRNILSKLGVGEGNMKTYFISGHLDLTREEFDEHYETRIREAVLERAFFVVGDAKGADSMAHSLLYQLLNNQSSNYVRVFHMFEYPRNNFQHSVVGGFESDEERDAAMTDSSDEDIAWVRPGKEKSGTAKNLKRRNNGKNNK